MLYLVPNLLGVTRPQDVLPERTLGAARSLALWAVETPKAARAFLKSIGIGRPMAELTLWSLSEAEALDAALAALGRGHDVGLLSDAGCPAVADPGSALIAKAQLHGIRVVPLVGPSAVLLALMASGMNGQHFCFHGYLPVKPDARAAALRRLEEQSRSRERTEIWIETPYRNAALLRALGETLAPPTRVCVAADLTLATETIECATAAQWRKRDPARFDKRPAIFLLQA
ncbi:MAG: SAM-dependent methyltransferase [Rudaea sp.]